MQLKMRSLSRNQRYMLIKRMLYQMSKERKMTKQSEDKKVWVLMSTGHKLCSDASLMHVSAVIVGMLCMTVGSYLG